MKVDVMHAHDCNPNEVSPKSHCLIAVGMAGRGWMMKVINDNLMER